MNVKLVSASLISATLAFAGCVTSKNASTHIVVSPNGETSSLQQALDKVLESRTSGAIAKDRQIVIEFGYGEYFFDKTAKITAEHGALLLKGKGATGTIFSGSRELGVFSVDLNGRSWRNAIPAGLKFNQLFINNKRAVLSEPSVVIREKNWVPGAWCWNPDNASEIVYIARPGENPAGTVALAGMVDNVLRMEGAEDVVIEGIAFDHNAGGKLGANGAAVVVSNSKRVSFRNCRFEHIANYGIRFEGGASALVVRHCWFEDAGSGGVIADGAEGLCIEDNVIYSCGTPSEKTASIQFGSVRNSKVIHNHLCKLASAGIVGGCNCEITGNRIFSVSGEANTSRNNDDGVRAEDKLWRARADMLCF